MVQIVQDDAIIGVGAGADASWIGCNEAAEIVAVCALNAFGSCPAGVSEAAGHGGVAQIQLMARLDADEGLGEVDGEVTGLAALAVRISGAVVWEDEVVSNNALAVGVAKRQGAGPGGFPNDVVIITHLTTVECGVPRDAVVYECDTGGPCVVGVEAFNAACADRSVDVVVRAARDGTLGLTDSVDLEVVVSSIASLTRVLGRSAED